MTLAASGKLLLLVLGVSISWQSPLENDGREMCPDGKMECTDHMTCCALQDGSYGCCPFPNATCCSDKLHCCPSEMTCDVKHGMCRRNDGDFLIWVETVKPVDHTVSARVLELSHSKNQDENDIAPIYRNEERKVAKKIECPGGNQTCADSYTCCETPSGDYACCPMVEAVCCSDHIHCCPKGSSCDTHAGRCTRKTASISEPTVKNIICPGGDFQCPDGATCCAMGGSDYGCCPLENASCCSDLLHCCPDGYKCTNSGSCVRSLMPPLPWQISQTKSLAPHTLPAVKLD